MSVTIEIEGDYNGHRWAKPDGSWMIGSLKDGTTIVGASSPERLVRGMTYRFSGCWKTHQTYGRQFEFKHYVAKEPVTAAAVKSYLTKYLGGNNTGIGTVKINKLIAELKPHNTVAVMKSQPERVVEITGISIEQAEKVAVILTKIERFEDTRMQLVQLFEGRGFSQVCIDECIKLFGVVAADRIRRDPFTLLVRKIHSAGFLRCDQLYRDLGLPEHRLKRQTICLWNQINQSSGSVWVEATEAISEMRRLISSRVNPKKAIILGKRAKWLSTKRDGNNTLWISESQESIHEHQIKNYLGCLIDGKALRKPAERSKYNAAIQG